MFCNKEVAVFGFHRFTFSRSGYPIRRQVSWDRRTASTCCFACFAEMFCFWKMRVACSVFSIQNDRFTFSMNICLTKKTANSSDIAVQLFIFFRAGYPIRRKVGWGGMRFFGARPDNPDGIYSLRYLFAGRQTTSQPFPFMALPKQGFRRGGRFVHIANVTNRFIHVTLHSPSVLYMKHGIHTALPLARRDV